jgi:hypothetical protein
MIGFVVRRRGFRFCVRFWPDVCLGGFSCKYFCVCFFYTTGWQLDRVRSARQWNQCERERDKKNFNNLSLWITRIGGTDSIKQNLILFWPVLHFNVERQATESLWMSKLDIEIHKVTYDVYLYVLCCEFNLWNIIVRKRVRWVNKLCSNFNIGGRHRLSSRRNAPGESVI